MGGGGPVHPFAKAELPDGAHDHSGLSAGREEEEEGRAL